MHLSEIGKIAETEWLKTFEMRRDMNLSMGEFIIMPNHFHSIIIIGENQYNSRHHAQKDSAQSELPHKAHRTDAMPCVSNQNETNIPNSPSADNPLANNPPANSKNQFGPQSKNLASIIRGFKIGVTTQARKIDPGFAWQTNYYEHIISNKKSFDNISNYIRNNPANWQKDKFH
jgi:putative transposase